jgi:hypothetical protein
MNIHLQMGYSCSFILNEKQLAQLMPIIEQLHFVEPNYVEGKGRLFTHKKFDPCLSFVSGDKIYTEEEFEKLKQEIENGS